MIEVNAIENQIVVSQVLAFRASFGLVVVDWFEKETDPKIEVVEVNSVRVCFDFWRVELDGEESCEGI